MSPRSAKRAPAKAGRGKPLPKPSLDMVLAELHNLHTRIGNLPLTSAREEMKSTLGSSDLVGAYIHNGPINGPQVQPPVVKDRLSGMIDRLTTLNLRLSGMENYLFSSPTPTSTGGNGEVAKPYGIEDQCSLLENLIEAALDQHERIHRRL